jgi:hypothetical protein
MQNKPSQSDALASGGGERLRAVRTHQIAGDRYTCSLGQLPGQRAAAPCRLVLDPDIEPSDMPERIEGSVEIAIGPEGGFADEELEAFRLAGFVGVRLGPRILRTETAAIAALTWLQTRYGDMQTL